MFPEKNMFDECIWTGSQSLLAILQGNALKHRNSAFIKQINRKSFGHKREREYEDDDEEKAYEKRTST